MTPPPVPTPPKKKSHPLALVARFILFCLVVLMIYALGKRLMADVGNAPVPGAKPTAPAAR